MTLPAYLDTHTAIVGASGAGKTVTAKDHVEALITAKRHVCIIDPTGVWHGLRTSADGASPGFPIPIFGGQHGDFGISPVQGETIGQIIADGTSAIVDLSLMSDSDDQVDFVLGMVKALRRKPRTNFHLVVDECEEFSPQTAPSSVGQALTRELIWVAKRGRTFGFVLTAITQRPADISKAVLSQMQTLFAHQLILPHDQDAVRAYLKSNGDKATLDQIMKSLPGLQRGERWVYSPRLGVLERGISPMPTTFDSSRTPAPGEMPVEPKMLASIDLGEIRKALAVEPLISPTSDEGEKIKPDAEVAALRARVAELEAEQDEWTIERAVGQQQLDAVIAENRAIRECAATIAAACADIARIRPALNDFDTPPPAPATLTEGGDHEVASRGTSAEPVQGKASGSVGGNIAPRHQRILNGIAWATELLSQDAVERNIVAWLADISPRSSSYANDLGALRTRGLIEYPGQGLLGLTSDGAQQAQWPETPPTKRALLEAIKTRLEPRHQRIVDQVFRAAVPITREQLAEWCGISPTSSSYANDLGRLRTLGLIDYPSPGMVGLGRVLS